MDMDMDMDIQSLKNIKIYDMIMEMILMIVIVTLNNY